MSQALNKSHISTSQKNALTEFMKRNPDQQSGKFSNRFSWKDAQKKWSEIGEILNSMPGASRDWKAWRTTWQDLKSRTKSKVSGIRRHERGTGGGPPIEHELSKSEEDIISIVKVVSIEGHSETAGSAVDFDFSSLQQPITDILVEEEEPPTSNPKESCHTPKQPTVKKTVPKKKTTTTLRRTVDAVNEYKKGIDEKNSIKKRFYEAKLKLLESIVSAKERRAIAAERKADVAEQTSSANEGIASALESIADSIL